MSKEQAAAMESMCGTHKWSGRASLYESRAKDQIEVVVSIRSKLEEEKEKDTEEETEG